jgi:hypothetical protein
MPEPRLLITLLVVGVAGLFDFGVVFLPIRLERELMTVILTALNTNGLTVAISYWLGSSAGSREKDLTIHNLSQKP